MNIVSCIVPNIFDFNNDQLTEILLYDQEDIDDINNTSILDATISYLIVAKRFNTELFWCFLDVKALTLQLHLNSNFCSFFSLSCFSYFYLSIIFRLFFCTLYVYFFAPRYITTYIYIYIPDDSKFFCLMYRG